MAGPCDAEFRFDGNLADTTGSQQPGVMFTKDGSAAQPVFVAGRSGQALSLDGSSAMRALIDLHKDVCPQITIAAWINIGASSPNRTQNILSTGSGSGPGIRVSGTNLSINGPANGLLKTNVIRPNSGWQFVAGVYDYAAGSYTMHWGYRSSEPGKLNVDYEWENAFWVGAWNDTMSGAATGILIDDVKVFGRALSKGELEALQSAAVAQAQASPVNPTALPGDQFTPNAIPGDQFTPNAIPGDQFTPNAIPGDQFESQSLATGSVAGAGSVMDNGIADDLDLSGRNMIPDLGSAGGSSASTVSSPPADSAPAQRSPVPVGEPQFSSVAGVQGTEIRQLDLQSEFLNQVFLRYGLKGSYGYLPFRIITSTADGQGRATVELSGYSDDATSDKMFWISSTETAIGRIEVCGRPGSSGPNRISGLRIWSMHVTDNGSLRYRPAAEQEWISEYSHCVNDAAWSPSVLCPGDTVGTGLVAHSRTTNDGINVLTGLQLICRNVSLQ